VVVVVPVKDSGTGTIKRREGVSRGSPLVLNQRRKKERDQGPAASPGLYIYKRYLLGYPKRPYYN